MFNNIIADSFSRIKNAQSSRNLETPIHFSKFMLEIMIILRNEGYIRGFSLEGKTIKVFLKYSKEQPTFSKVHLISKPSRRVYYNFSNLIKKNTQTGTFIISTSQGLLSGTEALQKNLGGEVVCYII